jgi:hypothetical protein
MIRVNLISVALQAVDEKKIFIYNAMRLKVLWKRKVCWMFYE